MGLGGTTKKLQKVINMAEELYERLNYLREQLAELSERVERTGNRVEHLQREQAANRVLLERLAEQQGIDVDEALENVSIEEPDRTTRGQEPGQQQGYESGQQRGQEPGQQRRQEQGQSRDRGQGPSSSPSSPR